MKQEIKAFMRPDDVAEYLGVSRQTIYNWTREWRDTGGRSGLRAVRNGHRTVWIRKADLLNFVEGHVE